MYIPHTVPIEGDIFKDTTLRGQCVFEIVQTVCVCVCVCVCVYISIYILLNPVKTSIKAVKILVSRCKDDNFSV